MEWIINLNLLLIKKAKNLQKNIFYKNSMVKKLLYMIDFGYKKRNKRKSNRNMKKIKSKWK